MMRVAIGVTLLAGLLCFSVLSVFAIQVVLQLHALDLGLVLVAGLEESKQLAEEPAEGGAADETDDAAHLAATPGLPS